MKTSLRWGGWWRLGCIAIAVLVAGCVTDDQVKQIVSGSNVAAMSAQLNLGGMDPSGPGAAGTWQQVSKQIEDVIAANPDQKAMNAALRVRQAVMLMQARQYNLAKSAFDEAALEDLHTTRDQTLKTLQAEFLWWYRTAGETDAIDFAMAGRTQAAIDGAGKKLTAKEDEGMRDFLAAMRAFIGVKVAKDRNGTEAARADLESALNAFAKSLPPGESAQWQAPPDWPPAGMSVAWAVSGANRRHFTAESLIAAARKAMTANAIPAVTVEDPYFQRRMAAP